MSGNFDVPSARAVNESNDAPPSFPATISTATSTLGAQSDLPNLPARLQHLRDVLRMEREQETVLRDRASSDRPLPQIALDSPDDLRRHHAIIRNIAAIRAREQSGQSSPPPRPASRTYSRPSAMERSLLQRQRQQRLVGTDDQDRSYADSLNDLQQAGARLAEASLELRTLIEDPLRTSSPDTVTQEHSGEAEGSRRSKRRKLESDSSAKGFSNVRYGHFGQVEPGPLSLEIVSCDGGNYSDARGEDRLYRAENVLMNDSSVYSTKSSRCNLVLRQQGETPFSLKKLVIRAPQCGFTAPLQQGMVFIAMSSDDLLARTAQYSLQYLPASAEQEAESRTVPELARARTALRPDDYWDQVDDQHSMQSPRRRDRRTRHTVNEATSGNRAVLSEPSILDQEVSAPYDSGLEDGGASQDAQRTVMPNHVDVTAATPPSFTVTTECTDEDSSADEDVTPQALAGRAARQAYALGLPSYHPRTLTGDDDEEEADDGDDGEMEGPPQWSQPPNPAPPSIGHRPQPVSQQTLTPGVVAMPSTSSVHQSHPDNGKTRDSGSVLAPHARFFIKRSKSKCSIIFEPAVSGRYILLKLWSPSRNDNIDIQSIVAHGFAGTRFFPAIELR
ncbi:MAG: hypothetical protein M1825_004424 [Sarcosagium campestre]|nr:MAG: hypothetical protein M1825_004424 [Sarcosagium campestre]